MNLFLVDDVNTYTYEKLVLDVSNASFYYPCYKSADLYSYFVNLIVALVNDQPIILVDSDASDEEITKLQLTGVNKEFSLQNKTNATTVLNIFEEVVESKSTITLFTSGTTGQPKKVTHTISNLTRNVRRSEHYAANIWAFAYNPTHMAGLQVFFQAFLNSNLIVNVFAKSRNNIYNLINEYSVTNISGTPTFYRLLLPFEKEYHTLQRVTLGGEKSDMVLHSALKNIFPNSRINNIYASTEAGTLFAAKGEYFQIQDSIKDKVKIINDELYVHKDLLGSSESFNFEQDYYKTGDLVEYIDMPSGVFKFKGRLNELINVGGYKVNPGEIESEIIKLPEVSQVVVYGRSNSVLGNIICCDIVLSKPSSLNETDVKEFLRNKVQDFKIPRKIKFVDSIELTRTGKLKRT